MRLGRNGHSAELAAALTVSRNGSTATDSESRVVDLAAAERAAADLLTALGARSSPSICASAAQGRQGYAALLSPTSFNATTFPNDGGYDEVVLARHPVPVACAHHLPPFHGTAHIAYLPGERIIGLQPGRVVDQFARDLQVQERLTTQIADWVEEWLEPRGVGVIVQAERLCCRCAECRSGGAHRNLGAARKRHGRPADQTGVPQPGGSGALRGRQRSVQVRSFLTRAHLRTPNLHATRTISGSCRGCESSAKS